MYNSLSGDSRRPIDMGARARKGGCGGAPVMQAAASENPKILHICRREVLRPLRDQILRISGFSVDSTISTEEGLSMFWSSDYDLVLVDVEGEGAVSEAERLCSEIKTAQHRQKVAFICNWRVANLTDCPDEIVRTEFDPEAFVKGVRHAVSSR